MRVVDKGIGIPSAQLKRIFKRFYRVPGRFMARVKGTGLGLFIVHSVVKKHGGRVFAESRGLGQGSTFTVHLPRVNEMNSVLIVEDEKHLADGLRYNLKAEGYE